LGGRPGGADLCHPTRCFAARSTLPGSDPPPGTLTSKTGPLCRGVLSRKTRPATFAARRHFAHPTASRGVGCGGLSSVIRRRFDDKTRTPGIAVSRLTRAPVGPRPTLPRERWRFYSTRPGGPSSTQAHSGYPGRFRRGRLTGGKPRFQNPKGTRQPGEGRYLTPRPGRGRSPSPCRAVRPPSGSARRSSGRAHRRPYRRSRC